MKKGKLCKKINYTISEEFIVPVINPSEKELKDLLNKKYFNLIKRIEKRSLGDSQIE